MVTDEDTLPFDIRMVTPGTPEYEALQAETAAFRCNSAYYDEHAEEFIERYPGPCIVVVFNDNEVRSFQEEEDLDSFLATLSEFDRATALIEFQPDPKSVFIPTLFVAR